MPPRSIASTSHSYALPGSRKPGGTVRLVAVGGSCGGAGASTLAAAIALAAAAQAGEALLVDADPWGGGLDLLLGIERADGLRWPDLAELRGSVSGQALMAALPETHGVSVLAAGRDGPAVIRGEALLAAVEAARAGGWPVVVDLPRPGAVGVGHSTEDLLADADVAALVVPARVRAAAAARLMVAEEGPWSAAALVVRPVPGGLPADEVAEVVGRPVVAVLAHDRSAPVRGERGEPPAVSPRAPLGVAARRLLAELPERERSRQRAPR